jgi:hypothetical protein
MKITTAIIAAYIKHKLANDEAWVYKALVTIYNLQTSDEKASGTTNNLNNVGFSGCDAEILSSFAVQYLKWNRLSPKQMTLLRKKMPRYHNQIRSLISPENMTRVSNDALNFAKTQANSTTTTN